MSFLAYGAVIFVVIAIFGVFSGGKHSNTSTPLQVASSDSTSASTQLSGRSIRVIDGDTVAVPGESRHIRLVGFNAPEVFSPKCNRELRLGQQATKRLRQLLTSAATVEYERVACSCKPGTEGTKQCNYGRLCGVLRVDGRDTGQILIAEGLAVRYQCGRYGCPPKPGNWCNG